MAERKATNKYIPSDFDPKKHGSVNGYRNSHPLRKRASKLSEGILVIRFEMPYNIWCGGCGAHIGMGVRYNAQKKKIGKYLSTPIWQFRMKCHLCSHWIEIHTDPKNAEYVIASGARRKVETYTSEDAGVIALPTPEEAALLAADPIHRLEHQVLDNKKGEDARPHLARLLEAQDRTWSDPYLLNRVLRADNRVRRKAEAAEEGERKEVQDRLNLAIPVLAPSAADAEAAREAIGKRDRMRAAGAATGLSVVVDDDPESVMRTADASVLAEMEERKRRKVEGAVLGPDAEQAATAKEKLATKLRNARVGGLFGPDADVGNGNGDAAVPAVASSATVLVKPRPSLVAYDSDSDVGEG
ncbi:hypothetical protein DFJ74DRAFT_652151 [Hyaloraphidium curvatum]|nr:hypothetical protein DFJ74DRAFT_652151 [Hyaloraphidium curvatum]